MLLCPQLDAIAGIAKDLREDACSGYEPPLPALLAPPRDLT